jgi:hypothetical protein
MIQVGLCHKKKKKKTKKPNHRTGRRQMLILRTWKEESSANKAETIIQYQVPVLVARHRDGWCDSEGYPPIWHRIKDVSIDSNRYLIRKKHCEV